MSKTALLRVIISGLLALACLANHALPRMAIPQLRLVPIDRLPRRIGDWTCVKDLPIEAKVRAILPNASFLSRLYRDSKGQTVELFLETSQDAQMFHSPTQCLPAQNWNIVQSHPIELQSATPSASNTRATEMQLQSGDQNLRMLYWYTSERQLDKWEALKGKLLNGRTPTRLFVRIALPTIDGSDSAHRVALNMAQNLIPAISELESREH